MDESCGSDFFCYFNKGDLPHHGEIQAPGSERSPKRAEAVSRYESHFRDQS